MARNRAVFTGILVALFGGIAAGSMGTHVARAGDAPSNSPHYTVVETQGFNLLVTDNTANKLYYYAVDKGQAPGAELKLRASVDLGQIGQPAIKPVSQAAGNKGSGM